MEKILITEDQVKKVLDNILTEEMSRVSRQDFNRTQFKIEELQNSLNETIKEFRKLEVGIPNGLQVVAKSRISSIGLSLGNIQRDVNKLKEGVRIYKRKVYAQTAVQTPTVQKV
jgi:hypothetical protein